MSMKGECPANSMVHNPIYDGPMYESISGDTGQRRNPILEVTTESDPDCKTVQCVHYRYVGEPTQLLSQNQQPQLQGKPFSQHAYDHLLDHKGDQK